MSNHPLEAGDLRDLTWGSVRWSLAKQMRVVADEGYRSLGVVDDRYAALVAGQPVTLTRGQIKSFVPESHWPNDIDAHESWTLAADDQLSPA